MAGLNKRKAEMTAIRRVVTKIDKDGYGVNNDEFAMKQDELTLQLHFDKFTLAHEELVSAAEADEVEAHIVLWNVVEEEYNRGMAELRRKLAITNSAGGGNTQYSNNDIKLARLEVQKFDGTLRNWLAFKDSFETLVHSQAFPEAYKLAKLLAAVQGDAVALVGGMYTGGYEEVWKALRNRYDSPRQLADIHVARFIGLHPLTLESTSSLLSIVDTVRESFRALAVMKLPVDSWDALAVPIVVSKLPSRTQQAWGMSLTTQEIPTLDELLTFIERRAHSLSADVLQWPTKTANTPRQYLATSSGNQGGSAYKGGIQRLVKTNLAATKPGNCEYCNDNIHRIARCPRLLAMPVEERFNKLKGSNLCFNCLKPGHATKACSSINCRNCNGRHHTLLCRGQRITTTRPQEMAANSGSTNDGAGTNTFSQALRQSNPTTSAASGGGQPPRNQY